MSVVKHGKGAMVVVNMLSICRSIENSQKQPLCFAQKIKILLGIDSQALSPSYSFAKLSKILFSFCEAAKTKSYNSRVVLPPMWRDIHVKSLFLLLNVVYYNDQIGILKV